MQRNGSVNSEDKVRKKHVGTGENEREKEKEKKNRHTVSHALCHIHFELKGSLAK